jgi:DNA repair photolyase
MKPRDAERKERSKMKPIYVPSGRAKEYGDYALNIYTGCPHRCYYCFAPSVKRIDRERFHAMVEPRKNIVEETRKQLEQEKITGKLIHLCFTCDPYPAGYDTTVTREIIKTLKAAGNHVQILTKSGAGAERDFDLLDGEDWFGVTITGYATIGIEPNAALVIDRCDALYKAYKLGIKTWISYEPVLEAENVLHHIRCTPWVNRIKIGKLNYYPSNINWYEFGHEVEALCKELGRDYYIKDSLRKEMEESK